MKTTRSLVSHDFTERFHSIPRDIKDKEKGGNVGVPRRHDVK